MVAVVVGDGDYNAIPEEEKKYYSTGFHTDLTSSDNYYLLALKVFYLWLVFRAYDYPCV